MSKASSNVSVRSASGSAPFGALLSLWPSPRSIADDLHCSYFTVASWQRRGFVPEARWDALITAARDRGFGDAVTLAALQNAQTVYEREVPRTTTIRTADPIVQDAVTAKAPHMTPAMTGSNTSSNDNFADWVRQYRSQKRLCEEANGVLRSLVKRAKADGVNTTAMIGAVKASKLEPDVVMANLRDQLRYMSIIRIPVSQESLFDWTNEVTQRTAHADDLWDAGDKGYRAGRHGMDVKDAPYDPGSEHHVEWLASWHKGQASIARELGSDVTPVAASRARPQRAANLDLGDSPPRPTRARRAANGSGGRRGRTKPAEADAAQA